eukprot:scaffold4437_cov391-Prasinococcus_capsulatus_cf.AAC.6
MVNAEPLRVRYLAGSTQAPSLVASRSQLSQRQHCRPLQEENPHIAPPPEDAAEAWTEKQVRAHFKTSTAAEEAAALEKQQGAELLRAVSQKQFEQLKAEGDRSFEEADHAMAARSYTRALANFNFHTCAAARCTVLSNRSAALLQLRRLEDALADAEQCAAVDGGRFEVPDCGRSARSVADRELTLRRCLRLQGLCRKGEALLALGRFEDAEEACREAKAINPVHPAARQVGGYVSSPAKLCVACCPGWLDCVRWPHNAAHAGTGASARQRGQENRWDLLQAATQRRARGGPPAQ